MYNRFFEKKKTHGRNKNGRTLYSMTFSKKFWYYFFVIFRFFEFLQKKNENVTKKTKVYENKMKTTKMLTN